MSRNVLQALLIIPKLECNCSVITLSSTSLSTKYSTVFLAVNAPSLSQMMTNGLNVSTNVLISGNTVLTSFLAIALEA